MKKFALASSLLVLAMLCAACGETKPAETGTSGSVGSDETEAPSAVIDHLPENLDLGGYTIRSLGGGSIYMEQESGDIIDDAIFRRNKAIEDRLNCTVEGIGYEGNGWDVFVGIVSDSVLGGSDDYDIVTGSMWWATPLSLNGMLRNLDNAPYLEIEAPWWATDYIRGLSYHGNYYWLTGPIDTGWNALKFCTFVNLRLWGDLHDEDIYEIVNDGKWTLDTLKTYAQQAYQDLNGDGVYDTKDRLGILTADDLNVEVFAYGAGVEVAPFDENGEPHLAFIENPDRLIRFWEKIYSLKTDPMFRLITYGTDGKNSDIQKTEVFCEGNLLFDYTHIGTTSGSDMRNMKDDYGILPMPKLDEEQETYITILRDSISMYGLPDTVSDQGRDAALAFLEAAAAEGYQTITPLYFEEGLKNKYIRDQRSVDIINMMSENPICDFGAQYLDLGFYSFLRKLQDESITSALEQNAAGFEAKLESMLKNLKGE